MSDDYSISYSYQWGDTPGRRATATPSGPAAADQGELFAYISGTALDLPDGHVLLADAQAQNRLLVTRDVSIALQFCRDYRTLRQHAEHLAGLMPELGNDVAAVQRVLAAAADGGMLRPAVDTWERLARRHRQVPPAAAPSRVFVITCDRPQALQRLLDSILQNAQLVQHERLFVIDDSRVEENARLNRGAVENFNRSSPRALEYVGAGEQESLVSALVAALPAQAAGIRFLFDRNRWRDVASYGLARNLCLLLSVGCRALVLDDDVLCSALAGTHRDRGVDFSDGQPEADFYPTQQHWQQSAAREAFDPLAGHLKCLGQDLSGALSELAADLDSRTLAATNADLLLPLHGDSRVLVTECGSYGDPGTGNHDWIYNLGPDSLQRMERAGGVDAALAGGNFWLGRYRHTFSPYAVMSQITGLDNAACLPPYFPAHRGEDALFGAMNRYLHPDSVALEYNWAIPHLPLQSRPSRPPSAGTLQSGPMMLCADLVNEQVQPNPGAAPEDRLTWLAAFMESHAGLPAAELQARYRRESIKARINKIRALTRNLQRCTDAPDGWRERVQTSLRGAVNALQQAESLESMPGLAGEADDTLIAEQFSRYAGGFAGAVRAWPAIREVAPTLQF